MFAKRLLQKTVRRQQNQFSERYALAAEDVDVRINVHYGVPSTASILAFDAVQRLLAIATSDGRIKVIGGDNIEGLLVSPKLVAYKFLEFLQNQGFLVSITEDNYLEVWDLDRRSVFCGLRLESNVTAFSVVNGSPFMYVGDDNGVISVVKFDLGAEKLLGLPYKLSSDSLIGATGISIPNHQYVVRVLPQPCTSGNRILIAYRSGLIILWDVGEARSVALLSHKDLLVKHRVVSLHDTENIIVDDVSRYGLERKEIGDVCWASRDGSIFAVGYRDGDIIIWDLSKHSSVEERDAGLSSNIFKLRLSSAEKRFPVISLAWSDNIKSCKYQGELFVYGGTGRQDFVTVMNLEWSTMPKDIKCEGIKELSLMGSFADMKLVSSTNSREVATDATLFVLSKPGCIHIYDRSSLWMPNSISGRECHIMPFPAVILTIDPVMTVAKCFYFSGSICEMFAAHPTFTLPGNKRWPVTGGVNNDAHLSKDKVHRLYVAGYQDGSVRIWDSTYPVFRLSCVLNNEVKFGHSIDSGASFVTALDLCSSVSTLAVGRECGLVQLYDLSGSGETRCHFVSETKREVHSSDKGSKGPRCTAVFDLRKSSVRALEFMNDGSKLVIGYGCSCIAVLDVDSHTVIFLKDPISNSPVISVLWKDFVGESAKSAKECASETSVNSKGELIFVLTKDSSFCIIDGSNGNTIQLHKKPNAVSMYVIEFAEAVEEVPDLVKTVTESHGNHSIPSLKDLYFVLCCTDSLRLYLVKSLMQATSKSSHKVKLSSPCCSTAYFRKDEYVGGLIVLYQTGVMEIRSLPYLEVLKEFPLLSNLRWNCNWNTNMDPIISSTEEGDIVLVNGNEVVFISVVEGESGFRIPQSLLTFYDEVLAAASNAPASAPLAVSDPIKKQVRKPGIIGVIKGLKVRKSSKQCVQNGCDSKSSSSKLDIIFARDPFPELSRRQTAELSIDDIEIDEPGCSSSSSFAATGKKTKGKKSKSAKVLLTQKADPMPRFRTQEEILAKYRQYGDVSSSAGDARNKLIERQEKLEKISKRSEDLRSSAEEFSSTADDLVKVLENRKWYHL